jgi:alanine racemase
MPRPIRATVHPAALKHNLDVARNHAGSARVWAVVKANAYGHGIERVMTAMEEADGLALLDLAEASRVRASGWKKPLLLLEGMFGAGDLAATLDLRLSPVVHHAQQIEWLAQAPGVAAFDVYLKINTGMNRLGFKGNEVLPALRTLEALPCVKSVTLMSHFANADRPEGGDAALAVLDATMHDIGSLHQGSHHQGSHHQVSAANSAATLSMPGAHRDWVRAGIMLYGGSPFGGPDGPALGLQATMTLSSEIIAVQSLRAGETVGYGSSFTAPCDMRIGVVACGYADGYPRHARDGTPVWVDGVVCPLAGRISMDMLTVDLTPAPHARIGSAVELWGRHVSIDSVARHASTIGYELMCAVAPRVPFVEESAG